MGNMIGDKEDNDSLKLQMFFQQVQELRMHLDDYNVVRILRRGESNQSFINKVTSGLYKHLL